MMMTAILFVCICVAFFSEVFTIGPGVQPYHAIENSYWFDRGGFDTGSPSYLSKYRGVWPCMWGERAATNNYFSGDTSYRICGADVIQAPCVAYSFGSADNFDFEDFLSAVAPQCEIHIFDPVGSRRPNRVVHQIALSNTSEVSDASSFDLHYHDNVFTSSISSLTLSEVMALFGHTHIDILKVDIEGYELRVFEELHIAGAWPSVGQLLVEFHLRENHESVLDRAVSMLEQDGFRLFSSIPNTYWPYSEPRPKNSVLCYHVFYSVSMAAWYQRLRCV